MPAADPFNMELIDVNPCVRSEYNWVQDLADVYHDYLIAYANPVVLKWTLVNTDRLNLFIIFCYAMFVNVIGPRMMKNRKPYDLRWIMVPYNIALVILNFYIFLEYASIRWFTGLDISCSPLDVTNDVNAYRLVEISWLFYISKYIELCDTIFFVLRKKEKQLSRLHLVHHSSVPIMLFFVLRSEPGGYNTFFPLANSFVHCVMYTYYGVSALGDDVKIHLRFKKYITMTQLIQFTLVLSYILSRPYYGCSVSKRAWYGNVIVAGFFFVLFCNFYRNEYLMNKETKNNVKEHATNGIPNGTKKSK